MDWKPLALAMTVTVGMPSVAHCQSTAKPSTTTHPPEVALVDEGDAGSVYRETAHSLRLYTYDRDLPSQSRCVESCALAWPPLLAPVDSIPVGDWSLVSRDHGKLQWAYRGKPVYTRYHDAPDQPTGDGIEGEWRILPHMPSPTVPN